MEKQDNRYIDIVKGFHRLGNFPTFDDEIYLSFKDAEKYAAEGARGGSAFPGQVIRIMDELDPKMYVIDSKYNLVSVNETISTDSRLTLKFDSSTESGKKFIELPDGYILKTITIKIVEPFPVGSTMFIGTYTDNGDKIIKFIDKEDLLIDEPINTTQENTIAGSEYVFNITTVLEKRTKIYVFLQIPMLDENDEMRGSGIIKIN